MPLLNAHLDEPPAPGEVRAALDHIAASEAFRGSPQLVAFLRYVVEATLRGKQDRIKGYTIAVEALGRGDDFDPQDDPIVRVEATRLRRAMHKYYEDSGKNEPLHIELPVGRYVPVFRRSAVAHSARRHRVPFFNARPDWRQLATAGALILTGAAIYAALDFWFDFNAPSPLAAHGFAAPPLCANNPVRTVCAPASAMTGSATN